MILITENYLIKDSVETKTQPAVGVIPLGTGLYRFMFVVVVFLFIISKRLAFRKRLGSMSALGRRV